MAKTKAKSTTRSAMKTSTRSSKQSAWQRTPKWMYGMVFGALLALGATQINMTVAMGIVVLTAVMAVYVLLAGRDKTQGKWSPRKVSPGPLMGALVVGVMSVTGLNLLGSSSAATGIKIDPNSQFNTNTPTCVIGVVSGAVKDGANRIGESGSQFRELGNNTVAATVIVQGDDNCTKTVTLASWSGPWGVNSLLPISKQTLFTQQSYTLKKGVHTVSVAHNDCRYQVDMVYGSSPYAPDGWSPLYPEAQKLGWVGGGNKPCYPPPTPPPPTPVPPTPVPVCPDKGAGTTRNADGSCPEPCPDMGLGTARDANGQCQVPCPEMGAGTLKNQDGTCPVAKPVALPQTGPSNLIMIAAMAVLTGYLFSALSKAQWRKTRQ